MIGLDSAVCLFWWWGGGFKGRVIRKIGIKNSPLINHFRWGTEIGAWVLMYSGFAMGTRLRLVYVGFECSFLALKLDTDLEV